MTGCWLVLPIQLAWHVPTLHDVVPTAELTGDAAEGE